MLRNYILTAIRNLSKNKRFAFINISGLAIGMAVAILILLYVRNELNYDKWYDGHEQTFRVYREWPAGGKVVWTPALLANALETEFPEIRHASGLVNFNGETMLDYEKDKLYVEHVAMTDSNFFKTVPLPFLHGNPENALSQPNSLVISKRLSENFFGKEDPIGKVIRFNDEDDYTVTGVLDEIEGNSHLQYEVYGRIYWENNSWTGNNRATYVTVKENTDLAALEEKIANYINPFLEIEFRDIGREVKSTDLPFWRLQPISDIHLYSANLGWITDSGGDIQYLYIFGWIAFIVLFIASINYMNLATARAAQRSREVGIRKVSGAHKSQIITQFLSEAVVQSFIAMLLALALAEIFLPIFNQITDRSLSFLKGEPEQVLLPIFGLTIVLGLLSGSYPAFFLSKFRPARVLKGEVDKGSGGQLFRRSLVVVQFSLSVILIIVMSFIFKQVNYMMDQNLGFAADQVLVVPMNLDDSYEKVLRLKQEFLGVQGVQHMATSSRVPGQRLPDWGMTIEGEEGDFNPNVLFTDESLDETIGLELISGRFLSADFATDSTRSFVVNEAFVKNYQLEEPIGKKLKFMFDESYGQIVGVVKDFHYRGLEYQIRPLAISGRTNRWFTTFKLSTADLNTTIDQLKGVWAKVEPEHPMRHSFLDADFQKQYIEQERLGTALFYATVLAILIALMGLFGLASYTAVRRTKEIGIRKVLGASVGELTSMLIRDFVRWVLIASIIAVPVGFLVSRRWLEDFAYQTEITALPFLLAICSALLIATITVSFQAIRTASGNPVESLRYE
jgi:putative ABC transport system permease protein